LGNFLIHAPHDRFVNRVAHAKRRLLEANNPSKVLSRRKVVGRLLDLIDRIFLRDEFIDEKLSLVMQSQKLRYLDPWVL
jgi:hypothetical protein